MATWKKKKEEERVNIKKIMVSHERKEGNITQFYLRESNNVRRKQGRRGQGGNMRRMKIGEKEKKMV